jgi:hypothetical protein
MRVARSIWISAGLGALCLTALGAGAATARTSELQEIRCDMMDMERGRLRTFEALDLRVLRDTARDGRFMPTLPAGVVSIMCSRNSIVPAANDDEVLWLGMPFHIAQMGSPGRLAVLELNEGRYRYRMLEGRAPDAEEQAAIDARLAEFQSRFPPTR